MPRRAELNIRRLKSGKWAYDLPPSLSVTGRRQQKSFDTKKLAELSRDAELKRHKLYGIEGHAITASLAQDAAKASKALKDYNVSLYAVASDWVQWQKEKEASCSLQELFDEFRAEKEKSVSALYLRDIDKFFAPLLSELKSEVVAHLRPKRIREVMLKAFKTPRQFSNAYRTIKPAFTHAVRHEYTSQNPLDSIIPPKITKSKTEALTLAQVKSVLNCCQDFRNSEDTPKSYKIDCSSALTAFCIMVFAGVRPEEITKLQWESIHLDEPVIIVDGHVAKTRSHRIIPISDNLKEWLELIPESERTGQVCPPNWRIRYAAVRHASGIKNEQQDILRHTFASYHLAAHGDFAGLQEAMGHGTSEMILKHYKALIRKPEAIKFWFIRPGKTSSKLKAC